MQHSNDEVLINSRILGQHLSLPRLVKMGREHRARFRGKNKHDKTEARPRAGSATLDDFAGLDSDNMRDLATALQQRSSLSLNATQPTAGGDGREVLSAKAGRWTGWVVKV
jgi:hypothetical protein